MLLRAQQVLEVPLYKWYNREEEHFVPKVADWERTQTCWETPIVLFF